MNYRVLCFNPKGAAIPVQTKKLFDYKYLADELEFIVNSV